MLSRAVLAACTHEGGRGSTASQCTYGKLTSIHAVGKVPVSLSRECDREIEEFGFGRRKWCCEQNCFGHLEFFAAAKSCRERLHEGANWTGLTLLMPPLTRMIVWALEAAERWVQSKKDRDALFKRIRIYNIYKQLLLILFKTCYYLLKIKHLETTNKQTIKHKHKK